MQHSKESKPASSWQPTIYTELIGAVMDYICFLTRPEPTLINISVSQEYPIYTSQSAWMLVDRICFEQVNGIDLKCGHCFVNK